MIKGCIKKTIVLRGTPECVYEYAYFILKPEKCGFVGDDSADMIKAAENIIKENSMKNCKNGKQGRFAGATKKILLFLFGFAIGALFGTITAIAYFFV